MDFSKSLTLNIVCKIFILNYGSITPLSDQLGFFENTLVWLQLKIIVLNQISQRLTSIIFYTLPLKASLPFGAYMLYNFSFLKVLFFITFPIVLIENSLPFGGLLLFLIIFAGVVRNSKIPYFVRFNAFQALLLEIAIIIISYLFRILPLGELGSLVFVFSISIFIYSIFQCIYGIEPEIPLISKSVRIQI